MMDHRHFNPYCRACVESKSRRKPKRKGGLVEQGKVPTKFGEQTTGDHLINRRKTNEWECTVTEGEFPKATTAVVLYDRACDWVSCYPKALRTTEETIKACQDFAGSDKIQSF